MDITGVYQILNTVNGKMYIGSSSNSIKRRVKVHFADLKRNKHHCQPLQRAFLKYGEEAFKTFVICYALPEQCVYVEQMYLDYLNPEYNTCPTAGSVLGRKLSEDHIKKISDRMKGNKIWLGKKMPEETKAKISKANKGRKPWTYGKEVSMETREKISKSLKGSKRTSEQRARMSAARKGVSPSNKGIKMRQSSIDKMVASKLNTTYNIVHIETGEIFTCRNLNEFCRNKNLQMPNLKLTLIGFASSGARVTQHKGYKLISAIKDEN